jgi:hypothetical protein
MSVPVTCPDCQKKLKVEDNVLGKNIRCPGCGSVFRAPAAVTPAAAPPPPSKAATPIEEDDDRPRRASARRGRDDDDEEEDRPRKKRSRREDDDEEDDDRRRKPKKQSGSGGKVLLIVGAVVLVLCGGCGGLAYYVYVKVSEGVQDIAGQMTDAMAKASTAPEFKTPPPGKPGSVKSGPDTKKAAGGPGDKPEGPKPDERPMYASEQQLADAMFDNANQAMATYVPQPLQLTGVVRKVTQTPDGRVNEIFFEPQVEDLKTHQKKPFPINCRLPQPVPRSRAAVGSTVAVRGRVTGGGKESATLNECVLVKVDAPSRKPEQPEKPSDQAGVLKAEEFGKDLYEGERAAYERYLRKDLQVQGVVHQQTAGAGGGSVAEVAFQLEVKDKRTGVMKPFLIQCKFATPVPTGDRAADLAVGKTITVRGKLGTVSYIDRKAILNDCALVSPGPSP